MKVDKTETQNNPLRVACLGSSTTAGKGVFNWIQELRNRAQNKVFTFLNFGVGGDLAYNSLQRLPEVIAHQPEVVIILIGANDVLAQVSEKVRFFFTLSKHLPLKPSPEWFRENLQLIIEKLKKETRAKVALVSLAPIGENLQSANPFQQQLNIRCRQYNDIIKEVALNENAVYIPLYESLCKEIYANPGKAFTSFNFLAFYRDYLFREFILGYSFDEIAAMNGWRFHVDGVHLNTRGGMILLNLVQEFLDGASIWKK